MGATVGLIVNPAAGRDIRRLVGGASVSDAYSKRRTAQCVLAGVTLSDDDVDVLVMPDRGSLGQRIVDEAPDDLSVGTLDMPVGGDREDTRRAAGRFEQEADAVVVLGGDGTNRDVAHTIGDVPVVSLSTGTNNVVPSAVDGTVAGGAAALVATGVVPAEEVTTRHGMVEAVAETPTGTQHLRGLATLGVIDQAFVGTRALLDASTILGGVVSRASPTEIGLSGIAGGLTLHSMDQPGGVGFRVGPVESTDQHVRAVTVPGVVERVGIGEWRQLGDGESLSFDIDRGVLSVDGERELELRDASIDIHPVADGPSIVDVEATYRAATEQDFFSSTR
ncbi:NAD(+)/NADH kinase [Halomarina rubra]|uniref:NAD(+)/NADH kinase n=1 Tax=Halomarina rubra TaxID=2071873 RepID=A0ABD6AUG8_9EURY